MVTERTIIRKATTITVPREPYMIAGYLGRYQHERTLIFIKDIQFKVPF